MVARASLVRGEGLMPKLEVADLHAARRQFDSDRTVSGMVDRTTRLIDDERAATVRRCNPIARRKERTGRNQRHNYSYSKESFHLQLLISRFCAPSDRSGPEGGGGSARRQGRKTEWKRLHQSI